MKPPRFNYHVPPTTQAALDLLAGLGDDAAILSGGQSLIPMLNMRLSLPSDVIDIGAIEGLDTIEADDEWVSIGAMVTHRRMETDAVIARSTPLARKAASFIGFRAIRNRGTIGGSVAHADPAAEWPAVLLALDGHIELASAAGTRTVPADDFFDSVFTTTKRHDELLTGIRLSRRFANNWGFSEFQRRAGDFAAVAVGVACVVSDGVVDDARIALAGVAGRPVRCRDAEAALTTASPTAVLDAASAARDAIEPVADSHGSSAYRKRLVFAEAQRAIAEALRVELAGTC